jgi:hypothetical protein
MEAVSQDLHVHQPPVLQEMKRRHRDGVGNDRLLGLQRRQVAAGAHTTLLQHHIILLFFIFCP